MKPCKHLDFDTAKYGETCTLVTLPGFSCPVQHWRRNNVPYAGAPINVQFCGQGRGRINGIFQCYNEGEMACYEPAAEPTMSKGIPADLTRVVDISKVKGSQPSAIAKVLGPLADGLREQGYTWFRVTAPADDEDSVYMEAWRIRPEIDGVLAEGEINRAAAKSGPNNG